LERALQNERELVMQLERSRVEMDKLRASNKYLEAVTFFCNTICSASRRPLFALWTRE